MEYVALTLAVAYVFAVAMFGALLRWQQRADTRERHLLVNQLLHATGRTWQPPPIQETAAAEVDGSNGWREWTATPEQEPVV